jgi:tRNA (cytidine32/uridine32-2'-O)-methyltransferase
VCNVRSARSALALHLTLDTLHARSTSVRMSIRIILVDTAHPGNIGAAARAMKNMGLRELYLVRPKLFPSEEATARASGANDVLDTARTFDTLEEAIADCGLVVGTSSRQRHLPWDLVEPRECAQRIAQDSRSGPVAIVFGSERYGMTNEELARCNVLVTIPTEGEYSSLNVAMAVQVIAYEVWLAVRPAAPQPPAREVPLATAEEMTRFYEHIEHVLEQIEFRDRTGGGHLMARIRRLFNRANLDQNEMNILRGILTAVQARRRPAGQSASQ